MVVLLSSSLKDFPESFLAALILPCTADERVIQKFNENINKMVQKLYILDEKRHINTNI